jgi:uncharacterized protein YukE
MANGNNYSVSEAGISSGLAAMEDQVQAMMQAGQIAENINLDISSHYKAQSSSVFQSKVRDWIDQYKQVMRSFERLAQNTSDVNKVLNAAEADAQMTGGNWGVSDGVYSALT